jgi:L-lactate dehydrogenase
VGVSPQSVHGYVLGEHGDSEVLVWSTTAVGGIPLEAFARQMGHRLTADFQSRIDAAVRHAGDRIIAGKGSTCYGIGAAIAHIVRAVRDDESALLTVSAPSPELGAGAPCLSLPRIVGARGVERTLFPTLSAGEREALMASARVLAAAARP